MNKAELIRVIAEKTGIAKKQAEEMVEAFVEIVTETLQTGGSVTIAGFGEFSAKERKGRVGVNPQNPTEKIQIPPVTVPKFKAGKGLKDALKKKPGVIPPPQTVSPSPQYPPTEPTAPQAGPAASTPPHAPQASDRR